MSRLFTQSLLVLLILAQFALGSSAGRVLCMGGGIGRACSGPSEAMSVHASCSHAPEDGSQFPKPVEPHDQDQNCDCVDVVLPVARAEQGTTGHMGDAAPPAMLFPLIPPAMCQSAAPPRGEVPSRQPPGPTIGLRSTRLLI